jgi:type I restriction enzyme S subunit
MSDIVQKLWGFETKLAAARQWVDALSRAVLARAFRGELVPTEAELARRDNRPYEPAADLLARIRAERAQAPAGGTKPRRGRSKSSP